MSNDYALFIVLLPNDFDKETSNIQTISQTIKSSLSARSMDTTPAIITPSSSPRPSIVPVSTTMEKDHESSPQLSTKSLCVILKNYFSEKSNLEAVWILTDNKKMYQITFYAEFGFVSDRILQDLVKLGIGTTTDTKIFVLPTTIVLPGQTNNNHKKDSLSTLSFTDDMSNNLENDTNVSTNHDLTLSRKIRKRINESNFKKSVRARLMVHQVVASIRASTVLSFDFVLLICLASMLAAFGLLENSTVIIVASMLVSPLMNPILGIVFGLSVREHSLWKRGFRNELIGLIICMSCGFILGLFTTFAETKWGSSTSFPTSEMKSRGDIKRLWVGVLIALPSGAGVALSVLGGNTGSLVGVAISASLLPPAVNCGLLFAYSLLRISIPTMATHSLDNTTKDYYSNLNCAKSLNNNYEPLYTCNLASETAILGCCSLLLTIVNIICIIIMALFILRIKEVVPLHQPNKDITNFFHHDVKVARDYNKTLHENDFQTNNLSTLTMTRNNLAQTIVNRWKTFKSSNNNNNNNTNRTNQQLAEITTNNDTELTDSESRRKLLNLKTFAKEYDLDVLNKSDYDLLTPESREKVRILISDLIDMCQEIPSVFVGLYHLQPCTTDTSTQKQNIEFYDEIIELLPPKWFQLFIREQQRRQIMSNWSSSLNRTHSLRLSSFRRSARDNSVSDRIDQNQSVEKSDDKIKKRKHLQRQHSVPTHSHQSTTNNQESDIPIQGTRFRIARPSTTIQILESESETS